MDTASFRTTFWKQCKTKLRNDGKNTKNIRKEDYFAKIRINGNHPMDTQIPLERKIGGFGVKIGVFDH